MKIIIIGAGEGGLTAASGLAEHGHEVALYEKKTREALGYEWCDVVSSEAFSVAGIPFPDPEYCFRRRGWEFCAPESEARLSIPASPTSSDYSVKRRPLKDLLISGAQKAGVSLFFDTEIDSLSINGTSINGVFLDGKYLPADLVVDSSGAFSKFRAMLPSDMAIQSMPASNEVFYAYRGIYEGRDNPMELNRAYIRFMGKPSISWCLSEPDSMTDASTDVMIGGIGALSQADIEEGLEFLRRDNRCLSEKLLRGGFVSPLPVRYTLSKIIADGYALVGDSAFMAMPAIGSGIATSMRAGVYLAQTVNEKNAADTASLWDYQVKCFRDFGATHASIDVFKRWLVISKNEDIRYLAESGIITNNDIAEATATAKMPAFSVSVILQKLAIARNNISLFSTFARLLIKSKAASNIAESLPEAYDKKAFDAWQKKYDGFFKSLTIK